MNCCIIDKRAPTDYGISSEATFLIVPQLPASGCNSAVTDTPHSSPPGWSSLTDPMLLMGMRSGVGAAGTGVSEDTAVGVRETIPEIYCGFSDDLINVPGNLKGPL